MLTSVTIPVLLAVLCALLYVWGRRGWKRADTYSEALSNARNDVRRAQRSADQWHVAAVQLKQIVDRVED